MRDRRGNWEGGFGILVGGVGVGAGAALDGGGHEPGADFSDTGAALVWRWRRRRRSGGVGGLVLHDVDLDH